MAINRFPAGAEELPAQMMALNGIAFVAEKPSAAHAVHGRRTWRYTCRLRSSDAATRK